MRHRSTLGAVALLLMAVPLRAEPVGECLLVENAFAQNRIADLAALELKDTRWQALQQFRLAAAYIPVDDRRRARKAVLQGLKIANSAIKTSPNDVEMLLMGAMLDGQILLLSPWRFFHNGLRGLDRLDRAETLDPDNPRAALVRGTAKVVLPAFLGGDVTEARQRFSVSLAASTAEGQPFAEAPLCHRGEWAQVDLLNWLGRAHDKLGDRAAAEAAYTQALERSPGNHWVRLAIEGRGYEWSDAEVR